MVTQDEVRELIEGASPERLESIKALLSMDDTRANQYGEALSLLSEADYNTGTLKLAIQKVKDEEGLEIVRTRTKARVFKFLKDEDNPDKGFDYMAFYVKMMTAEQKLKYQQYASDKVRELAKSGLDIGKLNKDNPSEALEFLKSEHFYQMLSEPNKVMRDIIKANMVQVAVDDEGNIVSDRYIEPELQELPEIIYIRLEEDLRLLMEQQGVMGKNSQMADILGY